MFNPEPYLKRWKNHIATFKEMGNMKILDFKKPDSNEYRMRFLFEEDYCILHISGDYGHLTASNYYNMTFKGFKDFVNNIGYFIEKINTHSRPIYYYDEKKAIKELTEKFEEKECEIYDSDYYDFEEWMDNCMINFDTVNGVSSEGYDAISSVVPDAFEFISRLGRYRSDILDIYMLAFKLAVKQLADVTKDEMFVNISNMIGSGEPI